MTESARVRREVAKAIAADVDALAAEIARYTIGQVTALGGMDDEEAFALTFGVSRANIGSMATMLHFGVPPAGIQPPGEAIDWARAMLRRGVELTVLLRAYRVGHGRLWMHWMRRAHDHVSDASILAEVLESTSEFLFAWIDSTAEQLVEEYGHERERWLAGAAAVRAETARAIVDGATIDSDAASVRLRYELRRHHVALVGWAVDDVDADLMPALQREGIALARSVIEADPLLVPAGRNLLWIWTASTARVSLPQNPGAWRPAAGLRFAIGDPAPGLDGFRRSHGQAECVRRLMQAAATGPSVLRYREAGLAATLCADQDRARAFALGELAGLAGSDPALGRLRETLMVYLDTGQSPLHAAQRLGVHAKTVANRMRRVEELLGRPIVARRAELEAALLVQAVLGAEDGLAGQPIALRGSVQAR